MEIPFVVLVYGAFLYVVLSALSTGLASAAHGQEWTDDGLGGKPTVVFLHFLAAPLVAIIFWGIFRRGPQAKSEQDLFGDSVGNYEAVRKAYYFWPLGNIMAREMRRCMERPWAFLGPKPTRMQQELCHALVGAFLAILTLPILFMILGGFDA